VSAPYAARFWDLHPDDALARRDLIAGIRGLREEAGLTGRDVAARMGWKSPHGALWRVERADNWQLRTLQALARLYGRRLAVEIAAPLPDDGDPLAAVYAAMRPASPAAADELTRAVLVRDLVRIRIDAGLRQEDVAAVMGVSDKAVQLWEQGADGVMVAPAQRYARAVGTRLTFRLTAVDAPAEVTA